MKHDNADAFLASLPDLTGDPYRGYRALEGHEERVRSPLEALLLASARAELDLRLLAPLPDGLVQALEKTGVPACLERAALLRERAQALRDDPVPALRYAAAHVADGIERRWFRIRLALALHAADDPEAEAALAAAWLEQSPNDPLRDAMRTALEQRGLPTESPRTEAVNPRKGDAALQERVDRLREQLASQPEDVDLQAELALARFEAGDPDAAAALEDVYIGLSHGSRWRAPLEAAFRELGLL